MNDDKPITILVTQRHAIRVSPARWKRQYAKNGDWRGDEESKAIYEKLMALDRDTCSAADVDAIIGNDSWTTQLCYACSQYVPDAVVITRMEGEFRICVACCEKVALLAGEIPKVSYGGV